MSVIQREYFFLMMKRIVTYTYSYGTAKSQSTCPTGIGALLVIMTTPLTDQVS